MPDWSPLWLTLKLATVTTGLLLLVGIPLGYWLAYTRTRLRPVAEAVLSLPLVLPPSVLGFYWLLAFSPAGRLGTLLDEWMGLQLVFSFEGLVLASVVYSLPFMVQPVHAGLVNLPGSLREAAYTLGKSPLQTAFRVLLPNVKTAIFTGAVLSFAHTIGEFGLVLMIGGNLPGETRVASIAVYDEVESLNYAAAHGYSAVLLALSFTILLFVYITNHRLGRRPAR
jgi:molybdate transport system permease protein